MYSLDQGLDGLTLSNYAMGGMVDISAPLHSIIDFAVADNSQVKTSVLTMEKWLERKDASFRSAITVITLSFVNLAMSYPIGEEQRSLIGRIGYFIAEGPVQYWVFWSAKTIVAGFVFSRFLPWAKVLTGSKRQLRFS